MSSEYSIRLGDKPIKGRVDCLTGLACTVVKIRVGDLDHPPEHSLQLFMPEERLLEASLLFHKIAQDLAVLLSDVDACCRCVPGLPDDQCAEHGYGAYKIKAAKGCDCTAPPPQPCSPYCKYPYMDGETVPLEEAAEHVDPPHRWG